MDSMQQTFYRSVMEQWWTTARDRMSMKRFRATANALLDKAGDFVVGTAADEFSQADVWTAVINLETDSNYFAKIEEDGSFATAWDLEPGSVLSSKLVVHGTDWRMAAEEGGELEDGLDDDDDAGEMDEDESEDDDEVGLL